MNGAELIARERQRQIEVEGYNASHDEDHDREELARAAACYVLETIEMFGDQPWAKDARRELWPWFAEYWKPTPDDPIRQLTKAGALIAAEIDRLQQKAHR